MSTNTEIREAKPGSSSAEIVVELLRKGIEALRAHPRDPRAIGLASRMHAFLLQFPEHFVTEFLERDKATGRVRLRRVPLGDWPDWCTDMEALDRRDLPMTVAHGGPLHLPEADMDESGLVRGEPLEAVDAIEGIAELLGVPCTQEAIEERIQELLEDQHPSMDRLTTDQHRLLWCLLRQVGGEGGILLDPAQLEAAPWDRCSVKRLTRPDGTIELWAKLEDGPDVEIPKFGGEHAPDA